MSFYLAGKNFLGLQLISVFNFLKLPFNHSCGDIIHVLWYWCKKNHLISKPLYFSEHRCEVVVPLWSMSARMNTSFTMSSSQNQHQNWSRWYMLFLFYCIQNLLCCDVAANIIRQIRVVLKWFGKSQPEKKISWVPLYIRI